ncbi:MAG: FAD-dependent thymidylate synthase [Thermoplasmata archaeon]
MEGFSNCDRNVFLIKLGRMIDRGALMSRYSRTSELDIRTVYEKEFLNNDKRGEEFYRKVFLEYGDESVSELVTAQIGMQNISNLITWYIEGSRIGLSFLEKSSRYVKYENSESMFLHAADAGITGDLAQEYDRLCRNLFGLYERVLSAAEEYYRSRFPIEGFTFRDASSTEEVPFSLIKDEKSARSARNAYSRSVRARALDEARSCLPVSTITNLGISGNARSFIYMVQKLKAMRLPEFQRISSDLYDELRSEFPNLMDNATNSYGARMTEYLIERNDRPRTFSSSENSTEARIMDFRNEDEEIHRIFCALKFDETGEIPGNMESDAERSYVDSYIERILGMRKNRREKGGRFFEIPEYLFRVTCSLGTFREFQRHRVLTIIKRDITPVSGFYIPEPLSEFQDIRKEYVEMMNGAYDLWDKIRRIHGEKTSQYIVPFAFYQSFIVKINLEELCYFIEIRSGSSAHPEIRKIALQMYDEVRRVHPALGRIIKFADTGEYPLGRFSAEKKRERKMEDIEKNEKI